MGKLTVFIAVLALACGSALAQTDSQQSSAPDTQSAAKSQAPRNTATAPPVMAVNVQRWRGTLIDANCSGSGGAGAAKADQSSQSKKDTSCPVTNSTTAVALLSGGQVLKFDAVGNLRATEELKNNKKWSREVSEGKPIHASIGGNLAGDTVTVTSIH